MSLERSLFAPVERIANALHPYRWRFFAATLAFFLIPFLFALADHLGWERFSSPPSEFTWLILLTLVAWSWSAFLLATWFGPSRPFSSPLTAKRSSGLRGALWQAARLWSLIILSVLVMLPVAVSLVVWL
jgi:hypothetical protein